VLGVDVQSTTAAVAEAPAVAAVTATVTEATRPVVTHVQTSTTPGPGAQPAVGGATKLAKPAVEQVDYTTASATGPPSDGSGKFDERAAAAAQRPVKHRSASLTHPRHHGTGPSATPTGASVALGDPEAGPSVPAPAATDSEAAPRRPDAERGPSDPQPLPPTMGGTAATAPAAGFGFAGLALLTAAVCLVGPRLRRRLVTRPAALRPVTFVVLLERPG
jgi:hypothetical protein